MIEFILTLAGGLGWGILIGLLPGIPAYIGPFLLFPFANHMSIEQILAFWLASHIGSQYFGSVAAILMRLPGEISSVVYLDSISKLSIKERLQLVRQTAWGSTVGSVVSLIVIISIFYGGLAGQLIQLTTLNIKLALLGLLIFMLCWFTERRALSFVLFGIGVFFAEKTNRDLPMWLFQMQDYTTDVTVFMLILTLLVIPEFASNILRKNTITEVGNERPDQLPLDIKSMLHGTWIGNIVGLIPGPSHILSTVISYKSKIKNSTISSSIISAESANNSSIIVSLMPFFYIGIPITLSEFLLNDLFQLKFFKLPTDMIMPTVLFPGINYIEFSFIVIAISIAFYHFSAQTLLNCYSALIRTMYYKLPYLFAVLAAGLIWSDITYNPVSVFSYFVSFIILAFVGMFLYNRNINVLPLIFGFLLGDSLCWAVYQYSVIKFL